MLWACGEKATESVPVDGPPQVRAEALGMHVVRIAWSTALADGAVNFELERRVSLQGDFELLALVPPQGGDSVAYLDTAVEAETMYGYRVRGIGPTGEHSGPSVVAGVLTPSRPGIVTEVVTTLPSGSSSGDPDGYVVRISGPDTASAVLSSIGGAASVTFKPLLPGEYAVRFNGIAAQCRASDSLQMVTVTDSGVNTLVRANFQVDCRDPNRGDVTVRVNVTRGDNGAPFTLRFVGQAADATLPDAERIVFRETTVGATGGSFTFDRVRPGNYETELRGIAGGCTLTGTAVRPVPVAALDADTVIYAVRCGGGAGGDFHPANPAKPYKLRYRFVPAQAAVGQAVALIVSADLSAGSPIQFSSVQALTMFDATALRFDGASFTSPYSGFANAPSGNIAWLATATSGPAGQVVELARFQFTVVGGAGEDVVTSSTLDIFDDLQGNTYVDEAEVLLEAPLQISGGGGNQPPVAAIGGGAMLSATVGVPVSLSGSGSSDPDGSITGYAWNLTGGAPPSATGATTSTTYAAAGTYTVQLTVTDDDGATASASKQVSVTSGGGGNQAPTAVIAGAATLGGVAGQAVSLSATGSTDPDGSITSYAWTLAGASPPSAAGANPSATWSTASTYAVQLTVTDNLGATGSASKQIIIAPPSSDAAVLRLTFEAAQPDGRVPLTLVLQFLADIPETPGAEALKSFRIDSVTWNGARLALDAVTNPSNVNLSTVTNPARPGWIQLAGTIVGSGAGGTVPLATLMLRPVAASSGSTTTTSGASQLIAPTALGSFNYAPRTRVEEATYP